MLTLYVDEAAWRTHLGSVAAARPGLVPVAKGNGYGFGVETLAGLAADLGADTIAVGTYPEAARVAAGFAGSVLVLTPWRPFETRATYAANLVHTIGRHHDLAGLTAAASGTGRPRVVLELLTSMRRHGFTARGLREAADHLTGAEVEGFALHLPLAGGSPVSEVERLLTDLVAAGVASRRVYVSHLSAAELGGLSAAYADFEFRPRIGTDLWLGDRGVLRPRATVLDVHAVTKGDVYGYRGRTAPRDGHLLVVSGGTAHGIGLESPGAGATIRDRAARVAKGGLDAAGFVRSPFTVDGKQRLFAEPPHMQVSMLFLPAGAAVPAIGAELPVQVRFTTTTFDAVVFD